MSFIADWNGLLYPDDDEEPECFGRTGKAFVPTCTREQMDECEFSEACWESCDQSEIMFERG